MAIITCRRKKNSFHVAFGTDTSICNASRIKSALAKIILLPVERFYIDLSYVADTDITFIQLLIAFNEKLKKQNRKMILINPAGQSRFIATATECGVNIKILFEIEDG